MPSAPPRPNELLQYLPQHRVLICRECHYAIQPSAISRHLKDLHHIYRSNRQEFMKYASGFDLADPKDVTLPRPSEGPVPSLTVTSGLACGASGCDHLCATAKRMKMHWAAEHSEVYGQDPQWRSVDLQTFFRGNQLRYFIIHHSSPTSPQTGSSCVDDETPSTGISTPSHSACDSEVTAAEDHKLLEHFKAITYQEIGNDATSRQVWRTDVPDIAAKHPFLMHGVLACSALHLASINPAERQRYQLIAAHHQSIALPEFRAEIENPNVDNCIPLLVFTQLLIIHCFAADQHDEDLLLVGGKDDTALPDWLQVIRGSCHIFQAVWPYIKHEPRLIVMMGGLEQEPVDDPVTDMSADDERLRGLFDLPQLSISKGNDSRFDSSPILPALLILIRAFSNARAARARDNYTMMAAIRAWPTQVPQEYFDLLRERDPAALILLAHYCILLRRLEDVWYICGYGRRLLSRIYRQLDEKWHPWLQWPLEEIGLP